MKKLTLGELKLLIMEATPTSGRDIRVEVSQDVARYLRRKLEELFSPQHLDGDVIGDVVKDVEARVFEAMNVLTGDEDE